MALDLRKFFQATNPSKTLTVEDEQDRLYYIDFSSVRGGQIIEEIRDNIAFFSPEEPTCQLFTGHIGCGKSTELRRLEAELKQQGFHVVYFESSEDLEMGDVDVGDILLAIARRVSESLASLHVPLEEPKGLKNLLQGAAKLLQTEIELSGEASLPGIGTIKGSTEGDFSAEVGLGFGQVNASKEGVSFVAPGIGKITAKAKNSPELRSKLREYLGPRTASLIEIINQELLEPAKIQLNKLDKAGLVVIVDNLDRVENRPTTWGRPQHEYLFVDRGEQLNQLNCHAIYTMPLALMFSNDLNRLTSRFATDPHVLPMVPVRFSDGSECTEGMALLRQMILARAFPRQSPEERLDRISEIFDTSATLDRLCQISGGHVRGLLRTLNDCIKKQRQFPITKETLELAIKKQCDRMSKAIDDEEWELLRQVRDNKRVSGDANYDVLVRSMFVYEYRDEEESWFEVNPLLVESKYFE
ncbi:ATP-binding protein [Spirulina sp. 06S082]|uniref:ATP-binding protein n=1 Tax=Spirulina sp. 06S082 TaxID=3110248 RepID=UPI002B21900E|nr:ATP-binding protein [Spirulina sp. 06S082]MEA5468813.1 ATP-binding protein [Spirulina sp. 06S082]